MPAALLMMRSVAYAEGFSFSLSFCVGPVRLIAVRLGGCKLQDLDGFVLCSLEFRSSGLIGRSDYGTKS